MRLSLIPLALLAVPIAEIAAFILVGDAVGLWWTLGLILLTAILGTILLRVQGFGLLARVQGEIAAGRVPAREVVHGLMLGVAGILLLTPGFITDTIGFALFVPALRDVVWRAVRGRVGSGMRGAAGAAFGGMAGGRQAGGSDHRSPSEGGTIELDEDEYRRTAEYRPFDDPETVPEEPGAAGTRFGRPSDAPPDAGTARPQGRREP